MPYLATLYHFLGKAQELDALFDAVTSRPVHMHPWPLPRPRPHSNSESFFCIKQRRTDIPKASGMNYATGSYCIPFFFGFNLGDAVVGLLRILCSLTSWDPIIHASALACPWHPRRCYWGPASRV